MNKPTVAERVLELAEQVLSEAASDDKIAELESLTRITRFKPAAFEWWTAAPTSALPRWNTIEFGST